MITKVRRFSSIEPLESRIAPARVILAGVPNPNPNVDEPDVDYNDGNPAQDSIFVNIKNAGPADHIAQPLGGATAAADTYYLRMFAGDVLKVFNATNGLTDPYFTQVRGNSVVFFQDLNGDNEVQPNELTGVSLGRGANVDIKTAVPGDIVANLDEKGTKSTADDELVMNGLVSSLQNIAGLTVSSSIAGDIIAGGKIDKVRVFGSVNNILAGSAANGVGIDFFPGAAGTGKGTLSYAPPDGVSGAPIGNLILNNIQGRIEAGKGGAGAAGGSLSNIQMTNDPDGIVLIAGDGGDANSKRPNGGAGGSVSRVYISGVDDPTANSLVRIDAGDGGDASGFNRGGSGGKVDTIYVGSFLISDKVFQSAAILRDNVQISAGSGGTGKTGGTGGGVVAVDINVSTPNGPGDEISVFAGDGGSASVAGGVGAGMGGSISKVFLRDRSQFDVGGLSDIRLKAGDGGSASPSAKGNSGGSIATATVLGFNIHVLAGDGSSGKTGGNGGSLNGVSVEENDGVLMRVGDFQSGTGGDGASGAAGAGGRIENIDVKNSNVTALDVLAGDGGSSVGSRGGAGGLIRNLHIVEGDNGFAVVGAVTVRSGKGGDGTKGGGAGGAISSATVTCDDSTLDIQSGDGGSAVGTGAVGSGGAAGGISVIAGGSVGSDGGGAPVGGSIRSGKGGDGAGKNRAGGIGGDISNVNFNVPGNVSVIAGDGGNDPDAAPGRGGSIVTAVVFAQLGEGELLAGNGGAGGILPATGGSIYGKDSGHISGLFTLGTMTIRAGDGTHGGAGGAIRYLGYGSTSGTLVPTPLGDILIKAGDGSAGSSRVGAGGSITNVSGSVASSDVTHSGPFDTTILAGNGGGSSSGSAAGGSISNLDIRRGGNPDGVLTIKAGDAGNSSGASRGAAGGAVTGVSIADVNDGFSLFEAGVGDFVDLNGAVTRLSTQADPVSEYLWDRFSPAAQDVLDDPSSTVAQKESALAAELNKILLGGPIYDATRFAGVKLSSETKDLIAQNPTGYDLIRLNRLLIDQAYPLEITKSPAFIIRSIAAGDGGNAAKTGGNGGTLSKIDVLGHDIGVRSGEAFGYDTMGGLFAGAGGSGTTGGRAGSVMHVGAQMIAAIVAGRGAVPKLADTVSYIYLGTPTDLIEASQGDLDLTELPDATDPANSYHPYVAAAYASNNLVGAVVNPTAMNGNRFHFVDTNSDGIFEAGERPIDGLIMAKTYNPKTTNFTPEALLTAGEFHFTEVTPGSGVAKEVQKLTVIADKFTLAFNGSQTSALRGNSTAATVAKALNALSSIADAGGVQVTQAGQTFTVTFNNTGARNAIVAPLTGFYDFDNVY